MGEFLSEIKRILMQMSGWGLAVSIAVYLSGQQEALPGLVLGIAASMVNFLLMCYRVRKSADLPPAKAVSYMRGGWLVRLSFIVLILILSLKLPQINFAAAVAGLLTLQIILVLNAVVIVVRGLLVNNKLMGKG